MLSGYAGWEPGQLAAEAERGAWHVVAASTAVVLDAVQGKQGRERGREMEERREKEFFSFFPCPSFSFSFLSPPSRPPLPSILSPSYASLSSLSHQIPSNHFRPPPRRPRFQGEGRDLGLDHGSGGDRARVRARELRLLEFSAAGREQRRQEEEREGAGPAGV